MSRNRFGGGGGSAVEKQAETEAVQVVEGNFVFTLHKTDHVTEREFEEWLEDN